MKITKPLGSIRCKLNKLTDTLDDILDSILASQLDQETKDRLKTKHQK